MKCNLFSPVALRLPGLRMIPRQQSASLVKKHHPPIRLFAAGGQTLGEATDVQLQLMAVGVEEVVRGAFAAVQLPHRHAGNLKASGEAGEIGFADAKRIMGVIALLRRGDSPLRIQLQA